MTVPFFNRTGRRGTEADCSCRTGRCCTRTGPEDVLHAEREVAAGVDRGAGVARDRSAGRPRRPEGPIVHEVAVLLPGADRIFAVTSLDPVGSR